MWLNAHCMALHGIEQELSFKQKWALQEHCVEFWNRAVRPGSCTSPCCYCSDFIYQGDYKNKDSTLLDLSLPPPTPHGSASLSGFLAIMEVTALCPLISVEETSLKIWDKSQESFFKKT